MKRIFAAITSVLGLSATAAPETKMVDPKTIYFSLATINDALPATDITAKATEKDLIIHEDDWRQFEAVSKSLDANLKQEIADVQRIFKEKSKPSGEYRVFSEIHVRKRIPRPIAGPLGWNDLLAAGSVQAASVSGLGLRDGQGIVKGGFSFHISQLTVFGIRHGDNIEVLCLGLTRTPSLSEDDAEKFAAFLDKSGITLVHWPSSTVFTSKQSMVEFLKQKKG